MSSLSEQVAQAQVNVDKHAIGAPHVFPQFNRLQTAKHRLELAQQEFDAAQKSWDALIAPAPPDREQVLRGLIRNKLCRS